MAQSFSVEAILKATDKNFSKVFGDAEKKADGFGGKVRKTMKTAGKVIAGTTATVVGLGTAAFAATKKVTSGFDEIAKTAPKLGVSTDAYQELDYWAGQNGLSTENMEKAVGRLNQRIGLAAEGNDKYASALERLDVNMDDVRNGTLSTEDAMTQSIQSLSQMTNEQEKSALASELFGTKLARELMPALQDGSLSLEDAAKKAEELGIVIDGDTLKSAEKFEDTWDDLTRMMGTFGQKVIVELMPVFQRMMDWIISNVPAIQATFEKVFDVISTVINWVVVGIQTLIGWLTEWFNSNEENTNGIWETIQENFTKIVTFLQETWEKIQAFWEEHGEAILDNVMTVLTEIWDYWVHVFGIVQDTIEEVLSWIVPFVEEMLGKIFDYWDENGEQIMEAVENVFDWLKKAWDWLYTVVMPIVEFMWNQIKTQFETALNMILGWIDFFVGLFTGDWDKMKEAALGIAEDMWEGIKKLFSNAWDFVKEPLGKLWDKIADWFTGLKDDAKDWGKNMIDGFVDGIKSIPGKVADAAKGIVDNVAGFLKFWSPAKKGEGRFITHWGANMIDGFLDGVDSQKRNAEKAMDNIVGAMQPNTLEPVGMDINGSVAQSHRQMSFDYNNELTVSKQPAYINLSLGGREYEVFVEDITEVQTRTADLKSSFR